MWWLRVAIEWLSLINPMFVVEDVSFQRFNGKWFDR
jgi:hypothetical protein